MFREKGIFHKEEIWKRIGKENGYENAKKKFIAAKKESDKLEKKFKKKVNKVLK